jgi:hypothetical protein
MHARSMFIIRVLATWYIRLKKTVLISLSFVFLVIFFERMCQVANTSVDAHDRIDHSCLTLSVNVLTRVSSHLLLARKHLTHNKSERYFVSCMGPVQTRYHFSLEVANCRH